MSEEIKTPHLNYDMTYFSKLLSPLATDPNAEETRRVQGEFFIIALAVLSVGPDKAARRVRLQAELRNRGLEDLITQIDSADPLADLSTLPTAGGWEAFDLSAVMGEKIEVTEYLIKPIITIPSVTIFFGPPKNLKSLIVISLSLSVANGIPYLPSSPFATDGFEVTQGGVMWADQENGIRRMKRNLRAFQSATGKAIAPGQFIFYSFPMPPFDASQEDSVNEMIARIQSLENIRLLIIDHLETIMGEVDSNSPQAGRVMGNIKRISEVCNIAIILIHHSNKANKSGGTLADSLRGSGAILANIDTLLYVKRDEVDKNLVQLIPAAVRGSDIKNVSTLFSYEQDPISLDLISAKFTQITWRDSYSLARDVILGALKENDNFKLNNTDLRTACTDAEIPGVSDQIARNAIKRLVTKKEIIEQAGSGNSKLYKLAAAGDEDDE